ncbi:hypothetical protein ONZ45_g10071 [Pleurotus djamor]|nr:hypothetical protein ONZ45_g10071 [Pleurotus djamor]
MPESQSQVAIRDQNLGSRTHRNPSTANALPDPNRNPNPPPPIPHSTRPNLNPPHATENAGGNSNAPSTNPNSDPHFLDPAVCYMTSMQYQYPLSPYIPTPPELLEPPVIPTHHPPHCSCASPPNVIVYPSPW